MCKRLSRGCHFPRMPLTDRDYKMFVYGRVGLNRRHNGDRAERRTWKQQRSTWMCLITAPFTSLRFLPLKFCAIVQHLSPPVYVITVWQLIIPPSAWVFLHWIQLLHPCVKWMHLPLTAGARQEKVTHLSLWKCEIGSDTSNPTLCFVCFCLFIIPSFFSN